MISDRWLFSGLPALLTISIHVGIVLVLGFRWAGPAGMAGGSLVRWRTGLMGIDGRVARSGARRWGGLVLASSSTLNG